jgi:hypothetical protein
MMLDLADLGARRQQGAENDALAALARRRFA